MPIGVPKVPYRLPGEETAQWVDLYNRLYRDRILFLCQDLDDELANQLIGIMLYLNAEDKSQGIFLYINSPGGSVTCGIGVYDAMNYIQSDVTTICIGTAASMASLVLAGGTRGKRLALPHCRIMIHQPAGGSQGQTSLVLSEAEEMLRIRDEVVSIYSNRTGQTLARISKDINRDQFMSAHEAKKYGLVDQIASSVLK
jgi:ATP-dependent Clp protease, protease subunit|uniref:ATP-dependent Clp protease proteolytic subunit n=6 Tax=Ulva TaxID=3118 RepID=A0A4Y6A6Z0_ULVCO|nr:ATP-dependent Clp protease proteolytic subunit [Ulva mutabilis]YP_009927305.1 ATP-dependent Clp protease proteolytic subunit [Ulva compressa]YP_010020389.1 ATP-dependent Clp protease proteolytic subunit 1 [Ulva fenestrata]YP_010020654.1 ATP-dependent Clp protease proteolytic subunit 1 [Ulva rigida]QXI88233.1 Clp protease proteolytic subunit [Ulva intestinalis]ARO34803.1 ATP-dependent Clp protease proteolytic subunit [Ulva compressa]QDE53738.1 ATP-dependent Clp protease proteolytic subunit 